ncbi:UNVERIFIED_CONTAM: hypothetical protein FKN15_032215 [Acipenser sinensis]
MLSCNGVSPSTRLADFLTLGKNCQTSPSKELCSPHSSAHRYHIRTDSGAAKTSTRCPPKCVPSANRFFSHCRLTMQPPRATVSEDNAAQGSLQASPQAPGQTTGHDWQREGRSWVGGGSKNTIKATGSQTVQPLFEVSRIAAGTLTSPPQKCHQF